MIIEQTVKDYLKSKNLKAYLEKPTNPDTDIITIEKTGSSIDDNIKSSTLAIRSYGSSMYNAATLNETVKTEMESLVVRNDIVKVELNTDYNYTDTTEKVYCYQAIFDIKHY